MLITRSNPRSVQSRNTVSIRLPDGLPRNSAGHRHQTPGRRSLCTLLGSGNGPGLFRRLESPGNKNLKSRRAKPCGYAKSASQEKAAATLTICAPYELHFLIARVDRHPRPECLVDLLQVGKNPAEFRRKGAQRLYFDECKVLAAFDDQISLKVVVVPEKIEAGIRQRRHGFPGCPPDALKFGLVTGGVI